MLKPLAALLIPLLLIPSPALAGGTDAAAPPLTYRQMLERPVPQGGLRLSYGPLPQQVGDLWLPAGPGPHPLLILVHGGCWQADIPAFALMNHMAAALRDAGIAVWNVEYRRLGEDGGGYPGTFTDIARAVDHAGRLTRTFPLDQAHIAIAGHSAGGHLALWAAGRAGIPADSPLATPDPLPVRGVVTLAGINDLRDYHARGPAACGGPGIIDDLVGAATRPGTDPYRDTSPSYFPVMKPGQTIISGTRDSIVPDSFGRSYAGLARAAGMGDVQVLDIAGAGHFELIDPTAAAWPAVASALRYRLGLTKHP